MAVDSISSRSNPAIYKLSANRLEFIKNGDFSLNIWEKFKDLFRSGAKQKMIEAVAAKLKGIEQGPYSDDIIKLKTFQTLREFAKPEDLPKFKIDIQHKTNNQTGEKAWSYSFMINGEKVDDDSKDFPYDNLNARGLLLQFEFVELVASLTSNLVNMLTNPRGENPPKDDVDSIRAYVKGTVDQAIKKTYDEERGTSVDGSIITPKLFENLFESLSNNRTTLFDAAELSYNPRQKRHVKPEGQKNSRLVYRPEIILKGQTICSGVAERPIWQQIQNERIASLSTPSNSKDLASKIVTHHGGTGIGAQKEALFGKDAQTAVQRVKGAVPNLQLPELPKPETSRPTIPLPEIPTSKNGA